MNTHTFDHLYNLAGTLIKRYENASLGVYVLKVNVSELNVIGSGSAVLYHKMGLIPPATSTWTLSLVTDVIEHRWAIDAYRDAIGTILKTNPDIKHFVIRDVPVHRQIYHWVEDGVRYAVGTPYFHSNFELALHYFVQNVPEDANFMQYKDQGIICTPLLLDILKAAELMIIHGVPDKKNMPLSDLVHVLHSYKSAIDVKTKLGQSVSFEPMTAAAYQCLLANQIVFSRVKKLMEIKHFAEYPTEKAIDEHLAVIDNIINPPKTQIKPNIKSRTISTQTNMVKSEKSQLKSTVSDLKKEKEKSERLEQELMRLKKERQQWVRSSQEQAKKINELTIQLEVSKELAESSRQSFEGRLKKLQKQIAGEKKEVTKKVNNDASPVVVIKEVDVEKMEPLVTHAEINTQPVAVTVECEKKLDNLIGQVKANGDVLNQIKVQAEARNQFVLLSLKRAVALRLRQLIKSDQYKSEDFYTKNMIDTKLYKKLKKSAIFSNENDMKKIDEVISIFPDFEEINGLYHANIFLGWIMLLWHYAASYEQSADVKVFYSDVVTLLNNYLDVKKYPRKLKCDEKYHDDIYNAIKALVDFVTSEFYELDESTKNNLNKIVTWKTGFERVYQPEDAPLPEHPVVAAKAVVSEEVVHALGSLIDAYLNSLIMPVNKKLIEARKNLDQPGSFKFAVTKEFAQFYVECERIFKNLDFKQQDLAISKACARKFPRNNNSKLEPEYVAVIIDTVLLDSIRKRISGAEMPQFDLTREGNFAAIVSKPILMKDNMQAAMDQFKSSKFMQNVLIDLQHEDGDAICKVFARESVIRFKEENVTTLSRKQINVLNCMIDVMLISSSNHYAINTRIAALNSDQVPESAHVPYRNTVFITAANVTQFIIDQCSDFLLSATKGECLEDDVAQFYMQYDFMRRVFISNEKDSAADYQRAANVAYETIARQANGGVNSSGIASAANKMIESFDETNFRLKQEVFTPWMLGYLKQETKVPEQSVRELFTLLRNREYPHPMSSESMFYSFIRLFRDPKTGRANERFLVIDKLLTCLTPLCRLDDSISAQNAIWQFKSENLIGMTNDELKDEETTRGVLKHILRVYQETCSRLTAKSSDKIQALIDELSEAPKADARSRRTQRNKR